MPVRPADSWNALACWQAVLAGRRVEHEHDLRCRASGRRLAMVRRILASSSIRFDLVCKRPAVSTMTTSVPRAAAASIASQTTADGSAFGRVRDDGHVDAPRPGLELLDGRRPERVAGRKEDPRAAGLEAVGRASRCSSSCQSH